MLSEIRAAIFDLDGTLIDSMGVWERIDREFLRRRRLGDDPEYLAALKTMNYTKAADYTIKRFHLQEKPEDLMKEWDLMAEWEYGHSIPLKPGARELLAQLKGYGMPIALATVSGPALYNAVLKRHGIDVYFDAYTDAAMGVRGKEFPDIYLQAANLLKTPPEHCIVFEDILMGLEVSSRAGFVTCAVEDAASLSEKDAIKKAADYYVEDLSQVLTLIEGRIRTL